MTMILGLQLNAADLYVNSSGSTGTYTTLTSALTAASDGDRIIVSTLINLIEDISIDKSVTITSSSSGNMFTLNGIMNVVATAQKEIRIIGADVTSLTFTAGTATDANNCKFYFVDSDVANSVNTSVVGLSFNVLYCDMPTIYLAFRYGSIIGSSLSYFTLNAGTTTMQSDTTYIIANKFTSECNVNNRDHNYFIANNYFYETNDYQLRLAAAKLTGSGANYIVNNTFYHSSSSSYGSNIYCNNVDHSNTYIYNNFFRHGYSGTSSSATKHIGYTSMSSANEPIIRYNVFARPYSNGNNGGVYWNTSLNSATYNNYLVHTSGNTVSTVDGRVTAGVGLDGGMPGINYYDIDISNNDVGTYGGPYSWDNYWDTSTGRARVFSLDMPFEIWMGQTPTIKADAVHEK